MNDSLNHPESTTFEAPDFAARALIQAEELYSQSMPFNTLNLERELSESFMGETLASPLDEEERARQRFNAQRWALQELVDWTIETPNAFGRLQVVLTTLSISSGYGKDATAAISEQMAHPLLLDGLEILLNGTAVSFESHRHRRTEQQQVRAETYAAARDGDYPKLSNLIDQLLTQLPTERYLAVLILAKFEPGRLTRLIEEKKDIFFSMAVRDALSEDALKFALGVNDITFKYVCAFNVRKKQIEQAPADSVDILFKLLLQVAETGSWHSWLREFTRYPQGENVADAALSMALTQLTPPHWSAFIDAVELWTFVGTPGPVEKILAPMLQALGCDKSAEMWRLAYERWNIWDYGREENFKRNHLLAPSVCSFDFPVAMYYANQPLDVVQAEEARLLEGIATVEQKWFANISELITYRNRLSSRLRLVQGGLAIRNRPSDAAIPLPARIVPDSEFAKFRYRYFDVNAQQLGHSRQPKLGPTVVYSR